MPEPDRRQRSPSVERRRIANGIPAPVPNFLDISRSSSRSPEPAPRIPPLPPPRFNPFAAHLPSGFRYAGNPTGPNQTDAILYETKDLLRELIAKATQIEQLLRIIHYNLQPAQQPRAPVALPDE